jgi:hypothetical protein
MAWMMVMGTCLACGNIFSFNPHRVPSFKGEPVCGPCMARVNEKRRGMGLPPHPVMPDAYEPEEVA